MGRGHGACTSDTEQDQNRSSSIDRHGNVMRPRQSNPTAPPWCKSVRPTTQGRPHQRRQSAWRFAPTTIGALG